MQTGRLAFLAGTLLIGSGLAISPPSARAQGAGSRSSLGGYGGDEWLLQRRAWVAGAP